MTVVDPRHPLYDQSFPLLYLKNKQELIPSCLVLLAEGAERLIPVSVTDLAASSPVVFPTRMDLSSLHYLTRTFLRILAQIGKECEDGSAESTQFNRGSISDTDSLGNIDGSSTRDSAANDGADLLPDCRTVDAGGVW